MKNKLTDAEKELMEILWTNKTAFMKDLLQALPEPKPAATTVATNLKRMQNKDLIGYKSFGNSRQYFPKVKKEDYFNGEMTSIINQFFNSSVSQFASDSFRWFLLGRCDFCYGDSGNANFGSIDMATYQG